MKNIFLPLSILGVLFFVACSDKEKERKEEMPVGTVCIPEKDKPLNFLLRDIDGGELNITIECDTFTFHTIEQPLVLINFFASWCPPCRVVLRNLNQIQEKYHDDIYIIGILINDNLNNAQLRSFTKKHGTKFYISHTGSNQKLADEVIRSLKLPENHPIPLSVLYKNGELFRYYEGAMPIEMIESEINNALKSQ